MANASARHPLSKSMASVSVHSVSKKKGTIAFSRNHFFTVEVATSTMDKTSVYGVAKAAKSVKTSQASV